MPRHIPMLRQPRALNLLKRCCRCQPQPWKLSHHAGSQQQMVVRGIAGPMIARKRPCDGVHLADIPRPLSGLAGDINGPKTVPVNQHDQQFAPNQLGRQLHGGRISVLLKAFADIGQGNSAGRSAGKLLSRSRQRGNYLGGGRPGSLPAPPCVGGLRLHLDDYRQFGGAWRGLGQS